MKAPDRSAADKPFRELSLPDRNRQREERAARLREEVQRAGGVTAVARKAQIPVGTLNKYLAGRDMPAANLIALAEACGVKLEWLALGYVEPPPELAPAGPSPVAAALKGAADVIRDVIETGGTRPRSADSQEKPPTSDRNPPIRLFNIVDFAKFAGCLDAVTGHFEREDAHPDSARLIQAAFLLYDILNEIGRPGQPPSSPTDHDLDSLFPR